MELASAKGERDVKPQPAPVALLICLVLLLEGERRSAPPPPPGVRDSQSRVGNGN